MSTTYTLFTEVQVADKWYCISPLMKIIDPVINQAETELVLVPTFETNARYHFEKTYYLMQDDGYPVKFDDLSDDLQSESAKPYDTVEKGFVISFPELPGCITCGETLDAALANAEDAKREWIAASLEMGNTIPLPRKSRLESCEKH